MRRRSISRLLTLCFISAALLLAAQKEKVRPAAVAGGFYPADARELTKMVDEFLARVPAAAIKEPVLALIVPHAGYV